MDQPLEGGKQFGIKEVQLSLKKMLVPSEIESK